MLPPPEARRLAELLGRLQELLPRDGRVAVSRRMPAALTALRRCEAGESLDRHAVVTALVFLELELRGLDRAGRGLDAAAAERQRLWSEIDAIADAM